MKSLMEQIATQENLYDAWKRVKANRGGPGTDAVTLNDFEEDLPRQLETLEVSLLSDTYLPLPLRQATMPKRSGGERELRIPVVADRVAQRAFLNRLEPIFEPVFLPCSFGYRPARGVSDAVERVLAYRAAGMDWILDADVQDFFPSVDHGLLHQQLRHYISDRAVLRVIGLWLEAGAMEAPEERISLVAATADRVRGALRTLLSDEAGEDTEAIDWERSKRAANLRRFGEEAARLAWDYRKILLPLLASKATLAMGGVGALAVGGVLAADYILASRKGNGFERQGARRLGTPQGGPISPLLSNVYLHPFDERITKAGLRLVRYADDFVICCPSQARAKRAQETAQEELTRLRLTLHPEKTRVLSCQDPLRFLGYEFDEDGAIPTPKEEPSRVADTKLLLRQVTAGGKKVSGEILERIDEMKEERKR